MRCGITSRGRWWLSMMMEREQVVCAREECMGRWGPTTFQLALTISDEKGMINMFLEKEERIDGKGTNQRE